MSGCAASKKPSSKNQEPGVVYITSSGFFPKMANIAVGDKLIWKNEDKEQHWVASNRHPVHTDYPNANYDEKGSYQGSRACIGEGQPKQGAFDSCRGISLGENYSFIFLQKGTFFYHDHLNYVFIGSVKVT